MARSPSASVSCSPAGGFAGVTCWQFLSGPRGLRKAELSVLPLDSTGSRQMEGSQARGGNRIWLLSFAMEGVGRESLMGILQNRRIILVGRHLQDHRVQPLT